VPKDLAALLLEDGAVSAEALALALARQREEGGALDTALLEEGAIAEAALVDHMARAAELPPAPAAAWAASDARARRVFPSRVAERHGLAPFALAGRELSLVATYPVDLGLLDEISFMLSLHLTAHVGPEWRVRELIHRLYGSPLPPRLAALATAAGAPAGPPPPDAPAAQAAPPEPPLPLSGFARDESEPSEPLAAAIRLALESVDPSLFEDAGGGERRDEEPEPQPEREGPAPDRRAPPRWSLDDARAALAAARRRDEVVLVALRYARDFFEYAAVFAVTRDAVAGHDALGAPGDDERERARSVAIYAADPGIFRTVIETRSPYLGPISREAPGNAAILDGLGRGGPRTVLVHPVLLRDRPVCVVYADNGEAPVSPRRLGDLLLLLSSAGGALERIIRDRKKRQEPPELQPPTAAPARDPAEAATSSAEPAPRAGAPEQPGGEDAADASPPEAEPDLGEATPVSTGSFGSDGAPAEVAADAIGPAVDESIEGEPIEEDVEPATTSPAAAGEPAPSAAGVAAPPGAPARTGGPGAQPADAPFFLLAPGVATEPPAPRYDGQTAPEIHGGAATAAAPAEPPTLSALADGALDADLATSEQARAALAERRRVPALRPVLEKLRRVLLSGLSGRSARAAHALGALRDADAIPLLIQVLETGDPLTAAAAAGALADITLQRIGPDAPKWLAWWKQNRGRGRAEWLFSALTSADREARLAASTELALAAPPPVAYSVDAPPPERERTARAWAGWWARSGHVI
jgi:Type II secretion system (T2SS), protein E, N-terminal domain